MKTRIAIPLLALTLAAVAQADSPPSGKPADAPPPASVLPRAHWPEFDAGVGNDQLDELPATGSVHVGTATAPSPLPATPLPAVSPLARLGVPPGAVHAVAGAAALGAMALWTFLIMTRTGRLDRLIGGHLKNRAGKRSPAPRGTPLAALERNGREAR